MLAQSPTECTKQIPATDFLAEAERCLARGWVPVPLCYPDADGQCACGHMNKDGKYQPHVGHDIGKAPLVSGYQNFTLETARRDLQGWVNRWPHANCGVVLGPSRLIFVGPDSDEALAEWLALGLPATTIRHSSHAGYLYARPDGAPIFSSCKPEYGDLKASGQTVVAGAHVSGREVFTTSDEPAPAPDWVVQRLTEAARKKPTPTISDSDEPPVRLKYAEALCLWTGELVADKDGKIAPAKDAECDRSLTLFYIGLKLAEANATRTAIVATLQERDEALGYCKYTTRKDSAERYAEIADKAVSTCGSVVFSSSATKQEPTDESELVAELRAEITRLRLELEPLKLQVAELLAMQRKPDKRERDSVLAALAEVESAKSRGLADEEGRVKICLSEVARNCGYSNQTVSKHLREAEKAGICEVVNSSERYIDRETGEINIRPALRVKFAGNASESRQAITAWKPEQKPRGRPVGRRCSEHPEADVLLDKRWTCAVCHKTLAIEQTILSANTDEADDDNSETEQVVKIAILTTSADPVSNEERQADESHADSPHKGGVNTMAVPRTIEVEPPAIKVADAIPRCECGATGETPFGGRYYCGAHLPPGAWPRQFATVGAQAVLE